MIGVQWGKILDKNIFFNQWKECKELKWLFSIFFVKYFVGLIKPFRRKCLNFTGFNLISLLNFQKLQKLQATLWASCPCYIEYCKRRNKLRVVKYVLLCKSLDRVLNSSEFAQDTCEILNSENLGGILPKMFQLKFWTTITQTFLLSKEMQFT